MKRTINEIYNIIIEKKKNALLDRERILKDSELTKETKQSSSYRLTGEYEAYTDVLILIESSCILDEK